MCGCPGTTYSFSIMINWKLKIGNWKLSFCSGLSEDGGEYRDDFRCFLSQLLDAGTFFLVCPVKDTQPVTGLARLFERPGTFREEVGPAVCSVSFLQHCRDRASKLERPLPNIRSRPTILFQFS